MDNKRTALQQAYLERAQALKETEGAPESTRVALSAISGRNILKTKQETEKIERDKRIAALQQQAKVEQGAAASALKMAQYKLSAAIQEDQNRRSDAFRFMDAGIYGDTLADKLDADEETLRKYAEAQKQNSVLEQQRRSEALSILNMGVYDPYIAQVLGFSEEVVKAFADSRAAEIADVRAKQKAAEQAKADYEAVLNKYNNGEGEKVKEWYEDEVDSAIDAFENGGNTVTNAEDAKKQILDSTNVGSDFAPWADPGDYFEFKDPETGKVIRRVAIKWNEEKDPSVRPDYENDSEYYYTKGLMAGTAKPGAETKIKEAEKVRKEQSKRQKQQKSEQDAAQRNREAAEQYYERAMAKRVVAKEAADKELSVLENAFKETEIGKVYVAKERISSAKTDEELASAYQAYADQITSAYNNIVNKNKGVLEDAFSRYEAGENLTDAEVLAVSSLQQELNGIKTIMQDAVDSGSLTEESKEGYLSGISGIEKMVDALDTMETYYENYSADETYRVMDEEYGHMTLAEVEEVAEDLKKERSNYEQAKTSYAISGGLVGMGASNQVNSASKDVDMDADGRYENIVAYIDRRKIVEENRSAVLLSVDFQGDTDAERIGHAIDGTGAELDEYNESYINGFGRYVDGQTIPLDEIYSGEAECPEWLGVDKIDVNGATRYVPYFKAANGEKWLWKGEWNPGDEYDVRYRSYEEVETIYKTNLEKQRILTNAYHRLSEDSAVEILEGENVKRLALEFSNEYDSKRFSVIGGEKGKYARGDEYKSKGWYDSFYKDVGRFVEGNYGRFSEDEATTLLALLQKAGDNESKLDIAFSYYTKIAERATMNEAAELGAAKWISGISSGINEVLVNGVFMLDNALSKDYSRVRKTVFHAAHQLTMEEFSKKTGILDDSLEFLYQAGYTVIDMVPMVALAQVPYVGQVAGYAYLYAKCFATTYDESIRNGWRADKALTYSTLTAASEVMLERAFSGIANVGGSKSIGNVFKKSIERLSTTRGVKLALRVASNMGSEGFEEFLQEVLSPFLEKVAADVNGMTEEELGEIDWEEAGKSFWLGAFVGGFFGGFNLGSADQSAALSQRALRGKGTDAVKIIQMAADIGNKRAIRIKEAMQNNSPIYKDQAGVRQYISESELSGLRNSIRKKNKKAMLQSIRAELAADENRDHSNDGHIYVVFKELLMNHSIDVNQTADLINDPVALKILNRITGENVGAMMPSDAMYLARIASFADKDGQVDHARIDALRDSFGELDHNAIDQIFKYEDMVAEQRMEGNFGGVLFEGATVEEVAKIQSSNAIEEMELLAGVTGKFYLISDRYASGSYLSRDVVSIRPEDVEKGAFYLLGHKAYYMMRQFDSETADVVKNKLFDNIEEMIGTQGIEAEKKKLRQQGVDEEILEDELCARMMPIVFLQGNYNAVDEIAKVDIEAANQLRNVIGSLREHLAENYIEKISAPEVVEASGVVRFENGVKPKNKQQRLAVAFAKHIASAIGIDIVFYHSEIPGTFGADANGYFYEADNSIHLDLNRTSADEGAIVFTLSHELVHFAQKFSKEKYDALADFLVENYGTETMEQLIQKKMEQLKTTDPKLAKSEVIADACERMLLDSDAMVKLQELKNRDQGLWEAIKQHIRALLDKVRSMLANVEPTSPEGVALQQMRGVLEQARVMFEDMMVDATSTYDNSKQMVTDSDNAVRMQLKGAVETANDLVAIHNITEELIIEAINRNGLVMPSIAVTNKGLHSFGEISFLFHRDVIDPEINEENELYGSDAWTPTMTMLKKNAKFDELRTKNVVEKIKSSIGAKHSAELFGVTAKEFKNKIIKADGSIFDAFAYDIGMQTGYAMEKGIISEIPTNKNGTVDIDLLHEQIDKELNPDEGWKKYKIWLRNISDHIITSFDKATNEEILENMRAQPATAKPFKLSVDGDIVVPAVRYNSIDDLRKNKDRLSNDAEEEAKTVGGEFVAFARKLGGNTKAVVNAINLSFQYRYSEAEIVRSFKKNGIGISIEYARELKALYKKAVELPTLYFEAKPDGIIDLKSIRAAVVPKNFSAELRKELERLGIEIVEYDGTKESRVEAINSVEDIKFQRKKSNGTTFLDAMVDMVNKETTELYDRLTEAVEKHYAVERAVSTERDPSAIFDGSEFTYADGERIAEENDGATWVKEFENMSPHEREVAIARQRADIDDLLTLLIETEQRIEAEDHTADEELVTTDTSETKKSIGESVSENWNFIRRRVTDVGATVYDIAKKTKDWKLYHYFNYARSSSNTAIRMVEDKQTDVAGNVVGKGLNEIFKPIMDRGAIFYRDFQLYLFHMHNVDRMSRESQQNIEAANDAFGFVVDMYPELRKYSEREILEISRDIDHPDNMGAVDYITALRNKEYWSNLQNKPIFGYKVTAEISKGKAEDLLRRYPEFKELAKEVYQYSDNLMQYRVDSGLITKEFAAKLKEIYPHYVPTARVEGGSADAINAVSVGNKAIIGKTVGRAQGGDAMLIPLHKQFADQTMAVVREGSKNRFGSMLLDMAFEDAVPQVRKIEKTTDRMSGIVSFDGQIDTVDPFKTEEFENIFVVYKDGEQYIMEVTPDLYEAAKSLSPNKEETNKVTTTARKANDLYKRLITGYNPAFAIRNFSRDIQDALLYTKDLKGFIQNYPLAWKEMLSNGEYWKKYQALGGTYSSVFDYKSGKVQKGKPIASQIEAVNMAIEQVARLAEFMSTVKKGDGSMDNLMEAMYNAAEITTNFGRSGTVGGFLNKNFVPFLNPSIQGFSKICRTLTETKGFRPWFFLVTKAAFLGWVIPSLLNGLLWGDDDEWDLIKQRDKDLNYLFKVKDGVWLKVPKGRVLSVLGMAGHRIQQEIQGEDADWGEFIATASSQVSPTNPLTNNIVTPFVGVASNRNWYGGEIVGQSLQNLPKAEQYDAKTDVISIWLGDALNMSPKKINYLLDQYTGVVGDVMLPALSVASERGFWENAFTIDTDYSNRLSGDFYDQLQELAEKKNSVSGTAEDAAKYRWWNRKANELSEVNKEINAIQSDSLLSKKEKEERLKVLYAGRNAVILNAEEEAEKYMETVELLAENMDLSSDDAADVLYREANREAFGAEEALKMYNSDVYERAVKVREEQGIDFDTFFDLYFDKSVDCNQAFKLIENGVSKDGAMEIGRSLDALEPEGDSESVTYLQKYDAIIGSNVGDDEKLAAMNAFANDADRRRVTIGVGYGISLEQFVGIKRNIQRLNDADGKTTASNARIEAAIRYQGGLTDKQRAVLWQVFSSSDSAKNNPFSYSVGAETLTKIEEYKRTE